MRKAITSLLKGFDRKSIRGDVERELRFHLEMSELENLRQGMSAAHAEAASRKRFGDLEGIRNECVEIRHRNRPVRRVLKTSLILVALIGLAVHLFNTDPHVTHMGDTLIFIAVSGRLLLYARSLSPHSFLARKTPSLTVFADNTHTPASD